MRFDTAVAVPHAHFRAAASAWRRASLQQRRDACSGTTSERAILPRLTIAWRDERARFPWIESLPARPCPVVSRGGMARSLVVPEQASRRCCRDARLQAEAAARKCACGTATAVSNRMECGSGLGGGRPRLRRACAEARAHSGGLGALESPGSGVASLRAVRDAPQVRRERTEEHRHVRQARSNSDPPVPD
jgi:hypothetical protein